MNNLTLRQLRYFDALAHHRHFGRAADLCAVSQPALSMQIKELEETLGQPLIERGPRQIRLTSFGTEFLRRTRDILRSVDELGDLARASAQGIAGPLRIGVIPTIAPYLLPRLMNRLSDLYPALEVSVRETLTQRLVDEMNRGQLDCAILALPAGEPSFEELELFREDFVLVRHTSEASTPVPSPEHLREMRLLLLEEGHCFRDQALSFCNMPSTRPRELMDGSSLTTLVQMVGAGMGVTLIPEMAVPVEIRSADVAIARFSAPTPSRSIGMIWRKTTPLAPNLRQIAEVVRSCRIGTPDV